MKLWCYNIHKKIYYGGMFMSNHTFNMRDRRKELGLTLEKVGDFVGVSKGTVSKWEKGNIKNMRTDKVRLLAKILKVSINDILGVYSDNEQETETTEHEWKDPFLNTEHPEDAAARKRNYLASDIRREDYELSPSPVDMSKRQIMYHDIDGEPVWVELSKEAFDHIVQTINLLK